MTVSSSLLPISAMNSYVSAHVAAGLRENGTSHDQLMTAAGVEFRSDNAPFEASVTAVLTDAAPGRADHGSMGRIRQLLGIKL